MANGNSRRNGTCDMSDICSLTSYNFFFLICYIILYIHYNTSTIILVSSIIIVINNNIQVELHKSIRAHNFNDPLNCLIIVFHLSNGS